MGGIREKSREDIIAVSRSQRRHSASCPLKNVRHDSDAPVPSKAQGPTECHRMTLQYDLPPSFPSFSSVPNLPSTCSRRSAGEMEQKETKGTKSKVGDSWG